MADAKVSMDVSSAEDMRMNLQMLLDLKERQLQQAGALGQRVLAQQVELEDRVRMLQDMKLNRSDEEESDAEFRERYRELAETVRAWDAENATLSSGFGSKPDKNASEPTSSTLSGNDTSHEEVERTQTAASSSNAQSRRARNAAPRQDDVDFAFEIGSGLLTEVRRLQISLSERDKAMQDMKKERDDLERSVEAWQKALRQQEQSSDQYKEENWNLEVTLQEMRTQLSDTEANVQRLEGEHRRLTHALNQTREAADKHQYEAQILQTALQELKVKHDADLAQAHEHASDLQRENDDLHESLDSLEADRDDQRHSTRIVSSRTPDGCPTTRVIGAPTGDGVREGDSHDGGADSDERSEYDNEADGSFIRRAVALDVPSDDARLQHMSPGFTTTDGRRRPVHDSSLHAGQLSPLRQDLRDSDPLFEIQQLHNLLREQEETIHDLKDARDNLVRDIEKLRNDLQREEHNTVICKEEIQHLKISLQEMRVELSNSHANLLRLSDDHKHRGHKLTRALAALDRQKYEFQTLQTDFEALKARRDVDASQAREYIASHLHDGPSNEIEALRRRLADAQRALGTVVLICIKITVHHRRVSFGDKPAGGVQTNRA